MKLVFALLGAALVSFPGVASATPSSSGLDDWSCRPSATHPRPVVFLHGLGSDSSHWTLHGPRVATAGYCAFTLTYGTNEYGTHGSAPVAESGAQISAFVDRVLRETGAVQVDLVGHSLGGFMALWVPKLAGDRNRIGSVVSFTPPTHGTTLFGALTLAGALGLRPPVEQTLNLVGCHACVDLLAGSAAVASLGSGPIAVPGVRYTVVATRYDGVVTPADRAFIREPGVRNYYVQDKCPLDPVGHFGIGFDTGVTSMILNGLDPAIPITCGFGPPV